MTAPVANLETVLANAVAKKLAPVHTAYRVAIGALLVVAVLLGLHFWRQGNRDAALWKARAEKAVADGLRQRMAIQHWTSVAASYRDSAAQQARVTDSVAHAAPRYVVRYMPRPGATPVPEEPAPQIVPVATSAAGAPLVPLPDSLLGAPMVLATAFDSLATSCTRERHDCAEQLAARDSLDAHKDSALRDLNRRVAAVTQERNQAERRSVLERVGYGLVSAAAGRLSCAVH